MDKCPEAGQGWAESGHREGMVQLGHRESNRRGKGLSVLSQQGQTIHGMAGSWDFESKGKLLKVLSGLNDSHIARFPCEQESQDRTQRDMVSYHHRG